MSGLIKIVTIAIPGGYMGADGPNEILAMIGIGAGDREYYIDLLRRGCKVDHHHPRRPFSVVELSSALQAMLEDDVLARIGSIAPDDIRDNQCVFISAITPIKDSV